MICRPSKRILAPSVCLDPKSNLAHNKRTVFSAILVDRGLFICLLRTTEHGQRPTRMYTFYLPYVHIFVCAGNTVIENHTENTQCLIYIQRGKSVVAVIRAGVRRVYMDTMSRMFRFETVERFKQKKPVKNRVLFYYTAKTTIINFLFFFEKTPPCTVTKGANGPAVSGPSIWSIAIVFCCEHKTYKQKY